MPVLEFGWFLSLCLSLPAYFYSGVIRFIPATFYLPSDIPGSAITGSADTSAFLPFYLECLFVLPTYRFASYLCLLRFTTIYRLLNSLHSLGHRLISRFCLLFTPGERARILCRTRTCRALRCAPPAAQHLAARGSCLHYLLLRADRNILRVLAPLPSLLFPQLHLPHAAMPTCCVTAPSPPPHCTRTGACLPPPPR